MTTQSFCFIKALSSKMYWVVLVITVVIKFNFNNNENLLLFVCRHFCDFVCDYYFMCHSLYNSIKVIAKWNAYGDSCYMIRPRLLKFTVVSYKTTSNQKNTYLLIEETNLIECITGYLNHWATIALLINLWTCFCCFLYGKWVFILLIMYHSSCVHSLYHSFMV